MIKQEYDKQKKSEICEMILRSLPKWFGIESAIINYIADVQVKTMLVAFDNENPIGFLVLNYHNKFTAEIHVMGILPNYHRKGIGKKLLAAAETHLQNEDFKFLTVKTVSASLSNKEYDLTRKFYFGVGFIPLEEFKMLWDEHNPCLFLVKQIQM